MPTYDRLKEIYSLNFSLGNLGKNFQNKIILISLICYTVHSAQLKKPDVTYYQIIKKLSDDPSINLDDSFIKGLAIICEDFAYGCSDFPTFDLKGKEIIDTIKNIFKNYLPF